MDPHSARVVGPPGDAGVPQHHRLERLRAVRRAAAPGGAQRDHGLHDADLGDADRDGGAARAVNKRKVVGLALGMLAMAILLGDDIRQSERRRPARCMILVAASLWACGTVLLRKWKPPFAQNALSGWMMLLGWMPLAILAPFLDRTGVVADHDLGQGVVRDRLQHVPRRNHRALGMVYSRAHAAVAVSSSLRCPCQSSACSPACCSWASGRASPNSPRWRWCWRRCSRCCSSRRQKVAPPAVASEPSP